MTTRTLTTPGSTHMFKKEYQGGAHVDVFSAQGRDPTSQSRLFGSVKRIYSKQLHSYVYVLEGGTSTTSSRIQLPKDVKTKLGLVQTCLVLQLSVHQGGCVALEVGVVDGSGSRRRINVSTSVRELSSSPLHARVPLNDLATGKWLHLCVDLESLVNGLFRGQHYKSLESLSVGGSCSLRRIFTLKSIPVPGSNGEFPRTCQLPPGIEQPHTVVVTYESVSSTEPAVEGQETERGEIETVGREGAQRPTHVAFGSKVPIPEHILTSRKTSRTMLSAGRQTTGDVATAREGGLRPHPPSAPADPSILRIQKKRVQLLSGGKQTISSKVQTTKQTGSTDVAKERDSVSTAAAGEMPGVPSRGEAVAEVPTIPSDEELAIVDILKSVEAVPSAGEGEILQTHNIIMDGADQMGTSEASVMADQAAETSGVWSDDIVETSGVWSDDVVSDTTYLYLSHPKSASDVKQSLSREESTSRGARLDDDFISSDDHHGYPQSSDAHNLSRLSDDYDWHQYASRDDVSQDEMSLRTRLAAVKLAQRNVSIDMDNSLTGSTSMTLSGWTERYREATVQGGPLQDSLELSDMGGTLTPALANTLTEQPDFLSDVPGDVKSNDQELDLMYDSQLNCFYDPATNKYYELVQ